MNETESRDFEGEAKERGVVFARFFALDENEDFEVFERAKVRVDQRGDIAQVMARCAEFGEQADLLDIAGYVLGAVCCDGSLEWMV